jgi:glycosyltransferase involved in cell wall biosynthesis
LHFLYGGSSAFTDQERCAEGTGLMRIAFVVHKFPPHSVGGVETYTWSLARVLSELGHQSHVFYPLQEVRPSTAQVERDGIHLWRVALPATREGEDPIRQYWHTFRDRSIEAGFEPFLAAVEPDVVHFQHVQGVSARLLRLAESYPRLLTLHDYWFFCATSQLARPDGAVCDGPRWCLNCVDCLTVRPDLHRLRTLRPLVALPLLYRNLYLRQSLRSMPLFLAPSEFLRQQYVQQGLPTERILSIELGLDRQRLTADTPAFPAAPGRPHFGYLGTLGPHKGVHVLVEAFNQLPERAALTVYGDESRFSGYTAELKRAAKHPNIRFAGALDHRHVGAALRQLDCLVVPSVWYENSPLVIQEAYGVGVPVVASRLGALPEKVDDGKTGWLFNAADSADLARVLRGLIDRPEQLLAVRRNIRPAPTMQQHAQRMLQIYQALIDNEPVRALQGMAEEKSRAD